MSDTRSHDAPEAAEARSPLDAEVEGRSVRFWVAVGVAIAVVVLGFGAWWVWGLDRGMPMDEAAMDGVDGMPSTDVFPSAPGDDAYSPLRTVVLVTWRDEGQARELTSADEVTAAADADEVDLEATDVVVNMPFLTWPEGER